MALDGLKRIRHVCAQRVDVHPDYALPQIGMDVVEQSNILSDGVYHVSDGCIVHSVDKKNAPHHSDGHPCSLSEFVKFSGLVSERDLRIAYAGSV